MTIRSLIFHALTCVCTICQWCIAQTQEFDTNQALEFIKRYEIKERAVVPDWAQRSDKPLFTVAWISDSHITDNASYKLNLAAFAAIRNEVKPDAVFVTGDNCSLVSNELWKKYCGIPAPREMSRDERAQQLYRAMLVKEIPGVQCYLLPGDNWYKGFSKVFGSDMFAFSMCGFRFIFASTDSIGNKNGCSVMSAARRKWLCDQLEMYRDAPVVYVQHEPLTPPTILDANEIAAMLNANSNVIGVLSGHLHVDLDLPGNGNWRQWCAPSIGRSHRPGFKALAFYSDSIIGYSYEWQDQSGKFTKVNKFQRITIPGRFRANLTTANGLQRENYSEMPREERIYDPSLDTRYPEVIRQLKQYAPRMLLLNLL